MPDWLTVTILGIIEGITEFLPISSTGHLLIAEQWLPRQSDLFNIVIQCGAVVAVMPLFRQRWQQLFLHWREPATKDFFLKVILAFGLTAVGGFILEKRGFKLAERLAPVAWAVLGLIAAAVLSATLFRHNSTLTWIVWAATWSPRPKAGPGPPPRSRPADPVPTRQGCPPRPAQAARPAIPPMGAPRGRPTRSPGRTTSPQRHRHRTPDPAPGRAGPWRGRGALPRRRSRRRGRTPRTRRSRPAS